jgi:hypothetical protein
VTKAWAARRHKESTVCKAGLQGVKRSRLSETLGLTPEEVETLCAGLDKMPGRSYEDEIFKKPEHKWLGRGGGCVSHGEEQCAGERAEACSCRVPAPSQGFIACVLSATRSQGLACLHTGNRSDRGWVGRRWCMVQLPKMIENLKEDTFELHFSGEAEVDGEVGECFMARKGSWPSARGAARAPRSCRCHRRSNG